VSGDHPELPVAERVRALEDRLIAAGLLSDAELDEILTGPLGPGSAANGATIVARAWTDDGYRRRLLADGNAAAGELGFAVTSRTGDGYRLKVVANTGQLHNVIVCTLCSCYPISLLGPSPSWYKSFAYRSRVVREPREVLAEFGLRLAPEVEIAVWDSTAETRYMVLPVRPAGTESATADELAALVTRNGLIGTATV
jgi:nitrile hydratase subunit alpha